MSSVTSKVVLEGGGIESSLFLLNFFIYIYGLELGLQLVVLVYSFFCYGEHAEPYSVVMIDGMIALLLAVEVRSHYLSKPKTFWSDDEMRFDSLVCLVSVVFILLYFLAEEGVVEISEDFDTLIHVIRETTRVLRLPTFIRNFRRMIETLRINQSLLIEL